ncbi:MAG TPA: ribosome-associated translation inhibitor RaiA [Bdellovibrionales bacterium]|nr:ribosome-associated translation inhibitor RaiA [Bdellovibrionales bacterium]
MDLHISFRNMDTSQALQVYTREKSEKLKKYFDGRISVSWNFSVEKLSKVAHCRLVGNNMDYFGEASTEDIHASVDQALTKIEKQLRKHKEIVKDHLHKTRVTETILQDVAEEEEEEEE